jgi:hypothetical protein
MKGPEVLTASVTESIGSSPSASTPHSQATSSKDVEYMKLKIKQLEAQLAQLASGSDCIPVSNAGIHGRSEEFLGASCDQVFHVQYAPNKVPQTVVRGVMHKTRLYGQSHWFMGTSQVC